MNEEDNQKAIKLANDNGIPVIAGSDAHCYPEIGNSRTVVKDLESLLPLNLEYKKSKQIYVTLSQYAKAFKSRSVRVFISATIVYIKYSARKCIKAIKSAFIR